MKSGAADEMELLRQRIEQNKFSCLKLYPNKPLLGKSKALRFKDNSQLFEERCQLFIEYAYLLLRVEVEQAPAFVSQHIFINPFGEVYLFYSFDASHKALLLKVPPGALVSNIINAFYKIFPFGEELADSEHQSLFDNTVHTLIPYFDDLREKSQKYYYQAQDEGNINCEFKYEPSNPYSVLVKLESSQLFRECNFPLKYNTAVLIRGVIDQTVSKDLQAHYVRLCDDQEGTLREANCLSSSSDIKKCVFAFYLKIFRYLQLLQKEAFLKVTVSEMDLTAHESTKKDEVVCCLTFQSNLKKEAHINKTSNEKSSESSIRNDKELTKEQKEKLIRVREYLQSLSIFKSRINFTVRVIYGMTNNALELEIEAVSLWTIDEIYYYHFLDFWHSLINGWYHISQREDEISEKVSCFKYEPFHKNKNIGVKRVVLVEKEKGRLLQQLIVAYDQIVIIFLLLEPILKKIYKAGYQLSSTTEKYFQELREPTFIDNKLLKLKEALRKYSQYYRQLQLLRK